MRAGPIDHAAVDVIAGPIPQHHAAARIQRREHQLAGIAGRHDRPGLGVDDLKQTQIGIKMIAAGNLVRLMRALRPGHLGFGESISGDNINAG